MQRDLFSELQEGFQALGQNAANLRQYTVSAQEKNYHSGKMQQSALVCAEAPANYDIKFSPKQK